MKITTEYWNILGKMVRCIIFLCLSVYSGRWCFIFRTFVQGRRIYIGMYRVYKFPVKYFFEKIEEKC